MKKTTNIWTGVPFARTAPWTSKHLAVFPLGLICTKGTGVGVGEPVVVGKVMVDGILAVVVGTTVEGTPVVVVGTTVEGTLVEGGTRVGTSLVVGRTTVEVTSEGTVVVIGSVELVGTEADSDATGREITALAALSTTARETKFQENIMIE